MGRPFALAILLAFVGCSQESSNSGSEAQKPNGTATTLVDSAPSNPTYETGDLIYPEKAEVMRLLVRANLLESKGEFEDALALAEQAVTLDPDSPKASAMKAKLQELLRRA